MNNEFKTKRITKATLRKAVAEFGYDVSDFNLSIRDFGASHDIDFEDYEGINGKTEKIVNALLAKCGGKAEALHAGYGRIGWEINPAISRHVDIIR